MDIQQEKELKSELWDRGGRGDEGKERKKGKDKEKRERRRGERTDGSGLVCKGDTPNAHVNMLAGDSKMGPAGFGWFHFFFSFFEHCF